MKFPAPPPAKRCECRIIKPGQNTVDPEKTNKCREVATRFISTTNGKVPVCAEHFHNNVIDGGDVLSRVTPKRKR